MNVSKWSTILVLFLFFVSSNCHSHVSHNENDINFVSGRVVKVLDGDTYDLLLADNTIVRVRMEGIDAPENGMPFSRKAKSYLQELCKNQTVKIKNNKFDESGKRILSFSYLNDGRELSHEMLKAGFAWHFKKYNSDSNLAALENEASEAKRGLWKDKNPMPPWENRKLHRQGVSTKRIFEITEENQ